MGVEVKVTMNPAAQVQLAAARRRGLLAAGKALLAVSSARAPYDPNSRHEVHMRDTGRAELVIEAESDAVAIAYSAFYAAIQHEDMTYKHERGEAKFLERTMLEAGESAFEPVAAAMREVTST
ncbi:MAG: hypothetical protein QOH56_4354 [Pseudonocardiales bacterium]|jgi:hypothetical protein|nr:hypothetical protein [Pseudonocardiales bacterium]